MHANRTYRFRLYPTQKQLTELQKLAASFRTVYHVLDSAQQTQFRLHGSYYEERKRELLLYTLLEEKPALKEIPFFFLESATKAYFKDLHQQKIPPLSSAKQTGFSLFGSFSLSLNRIFVPSLGNVKFVQSRTIPEGVRSLRFFEYHGKWYVSVHASFSLESPRIPSDRKIKLVGIDLGLSSFATLSTGRVIDHPKHVARYEEKINREQVKLSRKEKGSKNWIEQKEKLQKCYDKLSNSRLDFLHKLSSAITNHYDVIGIESLSVQSMLKTKHLSKSIYDTSFTTFCHFLKYKAAEKGKFLIEVDRYFPSSKLCSQCGSQQEMPLSQRVYLCSQCGLQMDRDMNAAKNIAAYTKNEFIKQIKR